MKRILIAGGCDFDDGNPLYDALDRIIMEHPNAELVSGGARGADTLAEEYAKSHEISIKS